MKTLAVVAAALLAPITTLAAENAPPAKVTPVMTRDLEGIAGKEMLVLMVEYPPGGVSQPHRHNASVFVYVLEGAVTMQVQGSAPVTLTNDAVIAQIGGTAPSDLLKKFGIELVTKFAERCLLAPLRRRDRRPSARSSAASRPPAAERAARRLSGSRRRTSLRGRSTGGLSRSGSSPARRCASSGAVRPARASSGSATRSGSARRPSRVRHSCGP